MKKPGQTLEDNFWLDTYRDELGINVVYDWIVKGDDEYSQKINITIATGELPDIMSVTATQMVQLAEADLIADISDVYEAYAADSLPGTGFEDYKKMVDFQASYTTNADNTANLNSVDYTTSLEGGLAIERVACIKQGNWVAPAVETTDPEVLQKLDMLPYSVPGYSDGKYFVGVSGYWAIHSKATDAQKAAAKDFINWMFTDPEAQEIVVNDCKFIPPYDNFDGIKASDPLSQRIMDANNSGNTMNGWVYSGAPNTWSQQVAGVEVQKYLAGEADWDEVTKTCIEQWSELRKQQNN